MQVFYMTLDFYDEIGNELTRKERSYRLFHAKEEVSYLTLHQSNAIFILYT